MGDETESGPVSKNEQRDADKREIPPIWSRRTVVFMLMNFFRSASMLIVAICVLRACDIAYTFIKSFGQATPVQNQGRSPSPIFSADPPNSANWIRSHSGKEKEMFDFKFNCYDSQCSLQLMFYFNLYIIIISFLVTIIIFSKLVYYFLISSFFPFTLFTLLIATRTFIKFM